MLKATGVKQLCINSELLHTEKNTVVKGQYPILYKSTNELLADSWSVLCASGYVGVWGVQISENNLKTLFYDACKKHTDSNLLLVLRDEEPFGFTQLTKQKNRRYLFHNLCLKHSHRAGNCQSTDNIEALLMGTTDQLLCEGDGDFEIIMMDKPGQSRRLFTQFHEKGWDRLQSQLIHTHAFRMTLTNTCQPVVEDKTREPTTTELQSIKKNAHHADISLATVRVLEIDGAVVGGVVIDTGPEVNLFGLMNRTQLVTFENNKIQQKYLPLLLAPFIHAVKQQGAHQAVLLHENLDDVTCLENIGFGYISPAIHWFASKKLLSHWQDHIAKEFISLNAEKELRAELC